MLNMTIVSFKITLFAEHGETEGNEGIKAKENVRFMKCKVFKYISFSLHPKLLIFSKNKVVHTELLLEGD